MGPPSSIVGDPRILSRCGNCSPSFRAIVRRTEDEAMDTQNITAVPQPIYSPAPIPVEQFVEGIKRLSEGLITKQKIYDYLVAYEIRAEDLERFKLWVPDRHTRNKIFRNDMIEVMLICWPSGTITPLHTHNGQLGWMTMIEGRLIVENYKKIACNR